MKHSDYLTYTILKLVPITQKIFNRAVKTDGQINGHIFLSHVPRVEHVFNV
jgi:riboflavin synthase alpha subunit